MSDYKPGTVAVATVRGRRDVQVMWTETRNGWVSVERVTRDGSHTTDPMVGQVWHPVHKVADVRPLVVLDLYAANPHGNPSVVLANILDCLRSDEGTAACHGLADQIEAQTRPPKPPEPTGLGAVVEDAAGEAWTRAGLDMDDGQNWWSERSGWSEWDHIDAVRILSDGVQP